MFKNYLATAVRSLLKHKFFSLLNITGLALSLAACLLLATWIRHELRYDNFHRQGAALYRASMEYSFGGQTARTLSNYYPCINPVKSDKSTNQQINRSTDQQIIQ
jgi:putative ABC transport system permease protein